jgi:hypothetical protein
MLELTLMAQITNEYALILGTGKSRQALTRDAHTLKDLKSLWEEQRKATEASQCPSVTASLNAGSEMSAVKDPAKALRRAVMRASSTCISVLDLANKTWAGKRVGKGEVIEHLQALVDLNLGVVIKLMPTEPGEKARRKDYGKHYFKKTWIKSTMAKLIEDSESDESSKNFYTLSCDDLQQVQTSALPLRTTCTLKLGSFGSLSCSQKPRSRRRHICCRGPVSAPTRPLSTVKITTWAGKC